MIRYIFCPKCNRAMEGELHPEDILMGWQRRAVQIPKARMPQGHQIEITAGSHHEVIPLPYLVCDSCNDEIPDGSPVRAVTMWQSPEPEPGNWETEFTLQ